MADDLLVRVDAQTAQFEASFGRATKSTLTLEAALKKAAATQAALEGQMAKYGRASEQAAFAQQRAAMANADLIAKQEALQRKQLDTLKAVGRGFGVVGLAAGVAFGLMVKGAADFEAKMAQVASLLPETQRNMIPALAEAAKGYADLGISASEAADAQIELVKAGVSAQDILGGALRGTLVLSAAGMIDVGQATEIAAAAMTQFQLAGSDVPHIADLLAAGADKALGSVGDLGEGLKQVGTTAHQFGFSIEETVGLLAEFAQAGLVGEKGGTTLKQMFLQLANPTKEAAALMDQYGISLYKANGTTKSGSELAGNLANAFKDATPAVRNQALAVIFGSRAIQGANILMADGAKKADQWRKAVDDQGFAAEQAAGKMDSLNGDLEKLSASFSNLLVSLGESGQGPLRDLVQIITGVIDGLNSLPDPVKSSIAALTALVAAVGLGVWALTRLKAAAISTKANMADLGMGFAGMSKQMMMIRGGAAVAGAGLIALGQSGVIASDGLSDAASAIGAAALGFAVGGPWGAAIGGGVALLTSLGHESHYAASNVATLTDTINKQTGALTDNSREMIAHDIATNGLLKLAEAAGASMEDTTLAAMGNADAYDRVADSLDGGNMAARLFLRSLREQMGSVDASKEAALALAQAEQDSGAATEDAGNAAATAADKTQKLTDALLELNNAALNDRSSFRAWKAAILDAQDALKENGKTLNLNTRAGIANQTQLDNLANTAVAHAQAMKDDNVSVRQQTAYLEVARATLLRNAEAFGMTKAEARNYINTVLQIPKDSTTNVHLNGIAAAIQGAANLGIALGNLHDVNITVRTNYVGTHYDYAGQGGHTAPEHNADGGFISGPGGPRDDKIPAWLSNGEFVVNAAATRRNLPLLHSLNAQKFADGGAVGNLSLSELLRMIGRPERVPTIGRVNDLNKDRLKELRDVERAENRLHHARERAKNAAAALEAAEKKEHVSAERLRQLRHRAAATTRDVTHAEKDLDRQRDEATKATERQKAAQQRLLEQTKTWASTVTSLGAAFGGEGTSVTAGGLLAKLRASTSAGKDFEHDLKVLKRKGIDNAILKQLRDEGPTSEGLALANSLAGASTSTIRQINQQQNALERVAGRVGTVGVGGHHGGHHGGGGKTVNYNATFTGRIHTTDVKGLDKKVTEHMRRAFRVASAS